ncbi:unnamed protein product [Cladocopium goreaui]|uniref:RING-type E3 ubiquitin transferase n=1 Tax=Cladocopium goreaui TaxID=2562237 RepID=A0A9P1BTJ1_9DINO|nr:unnamed protein product [Cladocopium goreaui]
MHLDRVDRAVDATEELHARKVAALLNSQNRLRCANAALKHEDLTRKEASNGRGAALARAERELLQQDVVLRAFYDFLGKDVARKQIRRALEAGPKRIRPTTREELRWKLEDLGEELAKAKEEAKEKAKQEEETEAKEELRGEQEEIKAQRQAIEEWKKRIAKLEQDNSAHQVEISSLERALQTGLERLDGPQVSAARRPPWQLLVSQTAPASLGLLKEKLLEKEKAFNQLQQERHQLQEELLEAQKVSQQLAQEAKERREELQRLRHGSGEAKRRTSVVHQGEILAMKKQVDAGETALDEVRARRNSMRAEQKGVVLDGKRRISVLEVDLARQQQQSQKELQEQLAMEEETLAAAQRERLEDIAKSERQAEAALDLCRKEEAMYHSEAAEQRAASAGLVEAVELVRRGVAAEAAAAAAVAAEGMAVKEGLSEQLEQGAQAAADIAEELALANGLSHQRAKEQAALAAAEVRAQTGSLAERQAALKRTIAIREDLISQTLQIQEEYEREKRRKDEMVLEKIDLELEMESETRTWERNMLDRKRMEQSVVTQLPGVVSSVDLICLRSELTVQKELTEQEVAQSRQEVAQAEAILAAVTEAAVEHKEMAARRGRALGGEDSQSLLDEARQERRLAKESLQSALEDLHLHGLRTQDGLPDEASCVADSDVSQDWIRVPIHVSDKDQLLSEVEEAKKALAVRRSVAAQTEQLSALHAEAEALEIQNLQLQEQKRDLELRISAAQFALKRWPKRRQANVRGCPFCQHCQVGDSG